MTTPTDKTDATEHKVSLREKFRIKPLELWELKPIDFSGFKYIKGNYQTFGLWSAITVVSPLLNFIGWAVRGFPYRHYSLVIDESAFTFHDGKGCYYTPTVIDGGKE